MPAAPAFSLVTNGTDAHVEKMGIAGMSVGSEALLNALRDDIHPNMGVLPEGIKWFSASRRSWIFVRPPTQVVINHHNVKPDIIDAGVKEHQFEIWLPWCAYCVDLDTTYYPEHIFVFALEGPLTATSNPIGILPLPNFYSNGKLCQPHRSDVGEQPSNISEGLALAYRLVWAPGFNLDMAGAIAWSNIMNRPQTIIYPVIAGGEKATPIKVMKRWESLQKDDVTSITDWSFPRHLDREIDNETFDDLLGLSGKYNKGTKQPLESFLMYTNQIDHQRRSDWAAKGLQLSLLGAVSRASIAE